MYVNVFLYIRFNWKFLNERERGKKKSNKNVVNIFKTEMQRKGKKNNKTNAASYFCLFIS